MDLHLVATVLDTPAPDDLAAFYERLLGWPRLMDEPDWIVLRIDPNHHALAFQRSPDFVAPVWPPEAGAPRMTVHLDFLVDDLEAGVAHALACGARQAAPPTDEHERVFVDPHGHPFCVIQRRRA
jgi:catechol 2,3-dioxygenase-like lactoylglutathione lyase family enzyme